MSEKTGVRKGVFQISLWKWLQLSRVAHQLHSLQVIAPPANVKQRPLGTRADTSPCPDDLIHAQQHPVKRPEERNGHFVMERRDKKNDVPVASHGWLPRRGGLNARCR